MPAPWRSKFTQRTIRVLVMACFISLSTAKVISGVRSIRTRSGAPWATWSITPATVVQVGSSSKPSTWRNTDSRPFARMGSSL